MEETINKKEHEEYKTGGHGDDYKCKECEKCKYCERYCSKEDIY